MNEKNRNRMLRIVNACALLLFSLIVNYEAAIYASRVASTAPTDIILSHTPVFDVRIAYIYAPVLFWLIVALLSAQKPDRIPFIMKSLALGILIRSMFISVTHIGPFPEHLQTPPTWAADLFTKDADFFFSGHTGFPFLMALIFWKERKLRITFIASSLFFAGVVLLAHLHYTLDVLGAYFIIPTIFTISRTIFKKDWEYFEKN